MTDDFDDDDTAELSAKMVELLDGITVPASTERNWEHRWNAQNAHNWPAYWQAFVDESIDREQRLLAMDAGFLIGKEREIRAKYQAWLDQTVAGNFPTECIPPDYQRRERCACVLCREVL